MILLSLIIPVYNVEPYIGQCLQSIADNSADMSPIEIIIVNDGTRDSSMDIVYRYSDTFPNIHIVEQDNLGLSSARMTGLKEAVGEWVWFVDSDDYLCPGALNTILGLIKQEIAADLMVFPLLWHFINDTKDFIDYDYSETQRRIGKDVLREQKIPVWGAPRYLINKRLFSSSDLFFPIGLIHEDEYFGRVLLYSAQEVIVHRKPVYCYRQSDASIMHNQTIRTSYDLVSIYKYLSSFCDSTVDIQDRTWFRSQIIGLLLESYTKNEMLYGTPAFRKFRKDCQGYIVKEYRKHCLQFNKNRIKADMLLLHTPVVYRTLFSLYYKKGR